jgi:hypothetical protein
VKVMKLEPAAVMVLALASLAGAPGCSSSGRPTAVMARAPNPEPSTTCPFGVRGARVSMTDTDFGVVLELRAYGGEVAELRRRAQDAAAMYGPGAHRGLGHDGVHGGGEKHGLGLAHLGVEVHAEAEDTPDGARITVRPVVASDLERMRKALHEREERARSGKCP